MCQRGVSDYVKYKYKYKLPVSCELRLAIKCEIPLGKEKQETIINKIRPVL